MNSRMVFELFVSLKLCGRFVGSLPNKAGSLFLVQQTHTTCGSGTSRGSNHRQRKIKDSKPVSVSGTSMVMKHARRFQTNLPRPFLFLLSFACLFSGAPPSMFRLGSGADREGGGGFELG